MKFFAVAGVIMCLVGLAYGYLFPAIPHPASVILNGLANNKAGLSIAKRSALQRVTRQSTPSTSLDDIVSCSTPAVRLQCESDFQPQLIQNAIDCGQNTAARYIAGICDRDPSGSVCGLVVIQELQDFTNAAIDCGSFLQGSTCPSGCASRLRSLRNSLGCCINSVFNFSVDASEANTGDPIAQAFQAIAMLDLFTYPLWSTCDVDTVGMCESSATITPVHDSPVCTTFEFTQMEQDILCNSADAQGIVDAIITAGDQCYDIGAAQALACSFRPNGQYCSAIVVSAGAVNNTQSVTPAGITLQCSQGQQSCSSGCRSAIQRVESNLGCCFNNVYNTSLIRSTGAFDFEASSALWNQCGVDTPGVCESTLDGNLATVTVTTKAMSSTVTTKAMSSTVTTKAMSTSTVTTKAMSSTVTTKAMSSTVTTKAMSSTDGSPATTKAMSSLILAFLAALVQYMYFKIY